jgi:3'-phosphoadenosine 5'-phosphosulfate sulfotransferase (PAPS reductase)/FAD synthetase
MKILIFYSGGKDSQSSLIWAVKEYGVNNCEAVFCDTGWENPVTYKHIRDTTKQLGVKLITLKSKKYDGMLDLAKKKKRFPSTKARFCTEELKSKPAIDYVLSQQESVIVIEGIRKNESFNRSKMESECMYFRYYFQPMANGKTHSYRKKDIIEWCKTKDASKLRPIFNWSADRVINYIQENGQQPNWLYYQGFSRVGCFPCIMARHREIRLIIDNHPKQWEQLKKAENEIGRTFFPPDYIPKHSCKNGKYPTIEDIEIYMKRKNATLDMFEEEKPSCMSFYGLCKISKKRN